MENTVYLKGKRELGYLIVGVVFLPLGLPTVLWLFSLVELNAGGFRIAMHGIIFLVGVSMLGYRRDYLFSSEEVFIYRCVWGRKVSKKIIATKDIKNIFCSVFSIPQVEGGRGDGHNGIVFDLVKRDHTKERLTCVWFRYPKKVDQAVALANDLSRVTGLLVEPDSNLKKYFVEEE